MNGCRYNRVQLCLSGAGGGYRFVTVTQLKWYDQPPYGPEMPRGFQEVKVPRLRDNGPEWW